MATYLGLCSKCGKAKESLDTNLGTVCMECFRETVLSGKETIFSTAVEKGRKVFVLSWTRDPLSLVTEAGLLYAFVRKEDAEYFFTDLKKRSKEDDLSQAVVKEMDADALVAYVLTQPGLRMIGVQRVVKEGIPPEARKGGA